MGRNELIRRPPEGIELDRVGEEYWHYVGEGIDYFIRAGQVLINQKKALGHGEWLPWLKSQGIADRTARENMQIAKKYGGEDLHNRRRAADLPGPKSGREALRQLRSGKDSSVSYEGAAMRQVFKQTEWDLSITDPLQTAVESVARVALSLPKLNRDAEKARAINESLKKVEAQIQEVRNVIYPNQNQRKVIPLRRVD